MALLLTSAGVLGALILVLLVVGSAAALFIEH